MRVSLQTACELGRRCQSSPHWRYECHLRTFAPSMYLCLFCNCNCCRISVCLDVLSGNHPLAGYGEMGHCCLCIGSSAPLLRQRFPYLCWHVSENGWPTKALCCVLPNKYMAVFRSHILFTVWFRHDMQTVQCADQWAEDEQKMRSLFSLHTVILHYRWFEKMLLKV